MLSKEVINLSKGDRLNILRVGVSQCRSGKDCRYVISSSAVECYDDTIGMATRNIVLLIMSTRAGLSCKVYCIGLLISLKNFGSSSCGDPYRISLRPVSGIEDCLHGKFGEPLVWIEGRYYIVSLIPYVHCVVPNFIEHIKN